MLALVFAVIALIAAMFLHDHFLYRERRAALQAEIALLQRIAACFETAPPATTAPAGETPATTNERTY